MTEVKQTIAALPVCVACVGDRTNPDGGPCLRCKGTGRDPDPIARLDGHLGDFGAALAVWATRDDGKAQPEVTQAGHAAVDAIDAMVAELRRLLGQVPAVLAERQDDARQLAEVRAILAGFDWEFDDRQLALEAIERIVAGGGQ